VVYDNGDGEQLRPELLDSLTAARRIEQFERSDGWAEIGIDEISGMGGPNSGGRERRSH